MGFDKGDKKDIYFCLKLNFERFALEDNAKRASLALGFSLRNRKVTHHD